MLRQKLKVVVKSGCRFIPWPHAVAATTEESDHDGDDEDCLLMRGQ